MGSFLTDNHRAAERNRIFEIVLLVLMVGQVIIMGITLLSLINYRVTDESKIKELIGFLPFWVAGLVPIIISRINLPLSEAKRQLLLIGLVILALLLLLGITVFSWEILKVATWYY